MAGTGSPRSTGNNRIAVPARTSAGRRRAGSAIRRFARHFGYDIVPIEERFRRAATDGVGMAEVDPDDGAPVPPDFDTQTAATWAAVRPYTVTSPERVQALCEAIRYLIGARVPGAFVECGVWKGGSALAVVRTLRALGADDREIYLFDTFDSFPLPAAEDVDLWGTPALRYHELLEEVRPAGRAWDDFPMDRTRRMLEETGYPAERLHFVAGLVEDTVPEAAPSEIALLRLDTDYYGSTKHELIHLFPRIVAGGVLIIDDYGHFLGCRKATDEYLDELNERGVHLLLQRIDYAGRITVVPARFNV